MPQDRNEANVYTLTILLVGLFIGMGTNFLLALRTFVYLDTLFHIVILSGVLMAGVHYIFFRHWNRYLAEVLAYCIFGWGNIILAILLSVNYFFHSEPVTTQYRLRQNLSLLIINPSQTKIEVKDKHFEDYPYMLNFEEDEIHGKYINGQVIARDAFFTTAKGSLGYKILLQKELR